MLRLLLRLRWELVSLFEVKLHRRENEVHEVSQSSLRKLLSPFSIVYPVELFYFHQPKFCYEK
jgi:hypothetical protein